MLKHRSKIRVRYADTDQMKYVYYAKYFEYFEQGRSDLLREIGVPYPEIESHGYHIPVIEAYAKYRKSAAYDELIEIETTVPEIPVARFRIDYKVWRDGDPEPLVEGYTVHSFLAASTGKPTRAPAFLVQGMEEAMKASSEGR